MNPSFYINNKKEIYLTHLRKKMDMVSQADSNLQLSGWVASEQCIFFRSYPPVRKKAILLKTLPYILEEYLIEPVENYHFTFMVQKRDEPVFSCVATRDGMSEWLEMLHLVSIRPKGLYPDIYALPYQPNVVHAFISDERCLARTGHYDGFCGKGELFYKLLKSKLEGAELRIITDNRSSVAAEFQDKIVTETRDWLGYLSEQALPDSAANLLHGEYFATTENKKTGLYKTIGWAALFLFAIWTAQQFALFESQQREIDRQRERNTLLYEQMFGQPLAAGADLRSSALAVMDQLANRQAGENDPNWELLVSLADFLNRCSPCVVRRFKLNGKKVEAEIQARNKEPISREQLREAGWRIQAWRSEPRDVPAGAQPVFETRVVMTSR